MRPLVSVIFPCYNAEKFLTQSLESVLNQDYSNLEVICIDDGSTDGTAAILADFQTADTRITIIRNERNLGLIETLNRGLEYVKGEFFARMDADDYCPPDRIVKQVEFIQRFPSYDLVSSGYFYFSRFGQRLEYVPPIGTYPAALKFVSLFSTPLTHASVLGRASLIKAGRFRYDKNYPHSEDYELFSRMAWQGTRIGNLREPLYWVRLNPESVSVIHNKVQINSHLAIAKRNLLGFGVDEKMLSIAVLKTVSNRIDEPISMRDLRTAFRILDLCRARFFRAYGGDNAERREIRDYLWLQKINILIQSNKAAFAAKAPGAMKFFASSLLYLRPAQAKLLARKIFVYLKFRTGAEE